MSTDSADRQQQKVREFMSLLPLTLAIAGLPECEPKVVMSFIVFGIYVCGLPEGLDRFECVARRVVDQAEVVVYRRI